jgi:hypothetical protein
MQISIKLVSRRCILSFQKPIREPRQAAQRIKEHLYPNEKDPRREGYRQGIRRNHSMSKFEAALIQQVNKAANGDAKAFREVLRLHEKVHEQEPYLDAPTYVVNFVKAAQEDGEKP